MGDANDFQHVVLNLLIAAVLAPTAVMAGQAAAKLRLPLITGYVTLGLIVGPHVLGILHEEAVKQLWFVDRACLSCIAFAAGSELRWQQLKQNSRQVMLITLGIAVFTWVMVYAGMNLIFPSMHLPDDMQHHKLHAISTLGATIMIARSPATAIAVLQETDGQGPFCSVVILVVVAKDVLTIILFSLNTEFVGLMFRPDDEPLNLTAFLEPFRSIGIAIVLGTGGSFCFSAIMRQYPMLDAYLQGARGRILRVATLLAITSTTFGLAAELEAEPLLACLVLGLVTVNRASNSSVLEVEELHSTLEKLMPHVNVAFFGLAGAAFQLPSLLKCAGSALIVFSIRIVAIVVGSAVGCRVAGCEPAVEKQFWKSMVTQAGVALGLARMVAVKFPDWGPHFQTQIVGIIILNHLVGPPLFKSAIRAMGEDRADSASDPSQQQRIKAKSSGQESDRTATGVATAHSRSVNTTNKGSRTATNFDPA